MSFWDSLISSYLSGEFQDHSHALLCLVFMCILGFELRSSHSHGKLIYPTHLVFSFLNEGLCLPGLDPNFFFCLKEALRLKGDGLPSIQRSTASLASANGIDTCIKPELRCFRVACAWRKPFALLLSVSRTRDPMPHVSCSTQRILEPANTQEAGMEPAAWRL